VSEPKALVQRLIDAINVNDLDVMDELFAAPSADAAKHAFSSFRTAFPDWHEEIEQIVAEGELVAVHFKCSGTHLGEFMGVAPTGKRMDKVNEVYFLRVRDGKFVEFWGMEDNLGRMRQLGID
jgi:predicted ester cyclase